MNRKYLEWALAACAFAIFITLLTSAIITGRREAICIADCAKSKSKVEGGKCYCKEYGRGWRVLP